MADGRDRKQKNQLGGSVSGLGWLGWRAEGMTSAEVQRSTCARSIVELREDGPDQALNKHVKLRKTEKEKGRLRKVCSKVGRKLAV